MWDALGGYDRGYVNLRPTFSEAPFTLSTFASLDVCNYLQPPSRESEILAENWLKMLRVFIPHAYLAPPMGSHVTISEKKLFAI